MRLNLILFFSLGARDIISSTPSDNLLHVFEVIAPNCNVQTRISTLVLHEGIQIAPQQVLDNADITLERAQMQQAGACEGHLTLELGLKVVGVHLKDEFVDRERPAVHRILYRSHALLRLAHALQVEAGSILAQYFHALYVRAADSEEDPAESIIIALLIDFDLLFPLDRDVCLALECINLFLFLLLSIVFLIWRCLWISRLLSGFLDELRRPFQQEVYYCDVAPHDGNVQAAGAFLVFLVVDAYTFEQFHHR